jgi:AcrR family transcriptional regulator
MVMSGKRAYHHGKLRATLLKAAAAEIERAGYETLSLREVASSLGVSRSAPYRHFADRGDLLAALAAQGFAELLERYKEGSGANTPAARLRACGRAYLALAAERPQLFRLMFASDLLSSASPPHPVLAQAAVACYLAFEALVAATRPGDDVRTIKATTIAYSSAAYGFALLRAGDRLRPFMRTGLSDDDLVAAVLALNMTDPFPEAIPDVKGRPTGARKLPRRGAAHPAATRRADRTGRNR